jgi:hypothetical protein
MKSILCQLDAITNLVMRNSRMAEIPIEEMVVLRDKLDIVAHIIRQEVARRQQAAGIRDAIRQAEARIEARRHKVEHWEDITDGGAA